MSKKLWNLQKNQINFWLNLQFIQKEKHKFEEIFVAGIFIF